MNNITKVITQFDSFGHPIPGFNLQGRYKIGTIPGGICTALIAVIILIYATQKVVVLINMEDVDVTESTQLDAFPAEVTVKASDIGFKMAFTVTDTSTKKTLNDPQYVKWYARTLRQTTEGHKDVILPFHECTSDEMDEFSPRSQAAQFRLDIMEERDLSMYCVDQWPEDMIIGGDR